MHVGLEHESSQQLREAVLHLEPVQREQFLGLIDDEERVIVTAGAIAAPGGSHVPGILESGEELHRLAVPDQLRRQRLGQRGEGPVRGCAHERRPPGRKGRQQAGPQERALAGTGGPNHRSQARASQLAKQRLHLQLAAEEEARVRLA